MGAIKNILFVMADQLRWDYLSCYGHPHLKTPHIDKLAQMGVRFDRAYVQSPVCGPSRASAYTGRTVFSHGSTWNRVPLPIGELTIGDYLRPLGVRSVVVGKTHMECDSAAMERLGASRIQEPGFEPYERDDGVNPDFIVSRSAVRLGYNQWLNDKGYPGENPWHAYANAAQGENGEVLSGWDIRNNHLPARIKAEHSETAFMTERARDFMEEMGDAPWLCHLSYIKPHWPYMAPAPYHDMFGPESFVPIVRGETERADPHPVYGAFMQHRVAKTFAKDGARDHMLSAYMGMIKQIDDQLGALFASMRETGRDKDTMIVFTSDHGDYLGDHWLGEKELFHEAAVRVPLIISDPRPEADATRGSVSTDLVELIDLVPTFLEAMGAPEAPHRLEGQSLMPLLRGEAVEDWRDAVLSEIDYAFYAARDLLGVEIDQARGYMLRDARWKYIHFTGFGPQLFDLEADPEEMCDLGRDPAMQAKCDEMHRRLTDRLMARKNRVSMSRETLMATRMKEDSVGVVIGKW